jgi:outer membrane protein assembly factor BamB
LDLDPTMMHGSALDAAAQAASSVLEHHLHSTRDGAYVGSNVTKGAAASVHMDSAFTATITGTLYGEPLYVTQWKSGQDAIFVATDQNHVTALDGASGAQLWDVALGPPVVLANLPCPRRTPVYGVMATPIIDLPSRTLYVESFQTQGGTTQKHYVYALSIDDGSTKAGWPVDVGAKVSGFKPSDQNDRGALTLFKGALYVPYASVNGDCGEYHGWVVGISTTDPTEVGFYSPPAQSGGLWAALSTDGTNLFAVTGNTKWGTTKTWSGGEALLHLTAGPKFSGAKTDYFTPSNWKTLDELDGDLGSSLSILFDLPGATPENLAVAMGKFGVVHLLDRDNLGGVGTGDGGSGEGLFSLKVTEGKINGSPASYTSSKGRHIVLRSESPISVCPKGMSGDLLALIVTPTSPPKLVPEWCATSGGRGSPIATTTDGTSNALVWAVSAEGTNRLFAFDGDTGDVVFGGGGDAEKMGAVYHWTSPIEASGRFIVGGNGVVYALTMQTH